MLTSMKTTMAVSMEVVEVTFTEGGVIARVMAAERGEWH